jgi:hypothetical protein
MSLAGTKSTQGDEYQLRIALHWLVRLLEDENISGIQLQDRFLKMDLRDMETLLDRAART